MESSSAGSYFQSAVYCRLLLLTIWLGGFRNVIAQKTTLQPKYKFVLSDPPIGLFDPIEISPSLLPHVDPVEPPPMYPTIPNSYKPILSGKCPANFSLIADVIDKTASDCSVPLAPLVGNVICCPQVASLMHIFQGAHGGVPGALAVDGAIAGDCFSDLVSILASRGANGNISALCSTGPSDFLSASCPAKDVTSFERAANISKLLDACSSVDPLKECCRPVCQQAIMEAAIRLSSGGGLDVVSDCKGIVYAWLSTKLSPEPANAAFRVLTGCKVNKGCPLEFEEPVSVAKACSNTSSSSSPGTACCSALSTYLATRQKQMLVTNLQAINCATMFGSMLQKSGVKSDIYGLCGIDLKDFSLQAFGQQGCLLRSLPTDIVFDNVTGISFMCDLSDNIAAPWPSSSSVSSISLCAPEMSLPALPLHQNSGRTGVRRGGMVFILLLTSLLSAPATMFLL